jgi:hypothetical protein
MGTLERSNHHWSRTGCQGKWHSEDKGFYSKISDHLSTLLQTSWLGSYCSIQMEMVDRQRKAPPIIPGSCGYLQVLEGTTSEQQQSALGLEQLGWSYRIQAQVLQLLQWEESLLQLLPAVVLWSASPWTLSLPALLLPCCQGSFLPDKGVCTNHSSPLIFALIIVQSVMQMKSCICTNQRSSVG